MQGEEVEDGSMTERGLIGDRAYAVQDIESGHIVSAKHPRKWGAIFDCSAAFVEPPQVGKPLPAVSISLPNGQSVRSDDPCVHATLSEVLGRPVRLISEAPEKPLRESNRTPIDSPPGEEVIRVEPMGNASPAGTFFDYAPIHILTTATLARLHTLYPEGQFSPRRFRPNLVIALPANEEGFVENHWLGHSFVTHDAVLDIVDPSSRCVVVTLGQANFPRDPEILRTVAQHNSAPSYTLAPGMTVPAVVGVYASVRQAGTMHRGHPFTLLT